jgi:hypothetical protein
MKKSLSALKFISGLKFILGSMILLLSCSPDPKEQRAPKDILTNTQNQQYLTTGKLDPAPFVFTAFVWPERKKSESESDYQRRLEKTSFIITENSKIIDRVHGALYLIEATINGLKTKEKSLGCKNLSTDASADLIAQCQSLASSIKNKEKEFELKDENLTPKVGESLEKIWQVLDDDIDDQKNWLISDEGVEESRFELIGNNPKIEILGFGSAKDQLYSLENGGLGQFNLNLSQNRLKFVLFEKNADGLLTSKVWHFDLTIAPFLNRLRMGGAITLKNQLNRTERQGRIKIDLLNIR